MKRIFLLLFLIVCSISQAQTNTVLFELTDNLKTYNSQNCLTNKTDYSKVFLGFVNGDESDIKTFKLVISLSNEIKYTFNSYSELRNTDPLSWLEGNKAFQQFKSINFCNRNCTT